MRRSDLLGSAFPPLLAVVLSIPCMKFPWLWDDYAFLARAETFHLHDLLSRSDVLFWRPFSREIWFALLWRIAPHTPLVAHLLHAAIVAVAVMLVGSIAKRLFGPRAGFLAATLYASLAALPMLIGWVSASQDLFAVVFFLTALHFRLQGRTVVSVLAAALAILSKETAVFLAPLLAVTPWIMGSRPRRPLLDLGAHAALLAIWGSLHLGIRTLLARHFAAGGSEVYVGIGGLDRLPVLERGLLSIFNLPFPGGGSVWREDRTVLLVCAAALIAGGIWWGLWRSAERSVAEGVRPRTSRGAVIAVAIALLPTLGTTALLRMWAPYYAALPGIGSAMLLGAALSRVPAMATAGSVLFMALGMLLRAQPVDPYTPTERNYDQPAAALTRVERGFRTVQPALPKGSHLLVTVAGSGPLQIDTHIHYLQAPRVWYGDPTIRVLRPNLRVPGNYPEFLFCVTFDLNVIAIDPSDGSYRSSGDPPDILEVSVPLRTYARALAATGEVDRGVAIFRMLEGVDDGNFRILDRRYAVMLLLASGRSEEASKLLEGVPEVPRHAALDIIASLYADAVADTAMEAASFPAFGVALNDTEANRYIMRRLNRAGHWRAVLRLARRIQSVQPGDAESGALIQEILARPARDFVVEPLTDDPL